MRFLRVLPALALALTLSGCGFVHFGRLPDAPTSDAALNTAYSNLSTEHKILKQELALARKEGDALRLALDRGNAGGSPDLANRLNETTRELATLRANYAKLSETKTPAGAQTSELEEKLAISLRNYTQLQEENARLRTEVDRAHAENSTLTAQVKSLGTQNQQSQSALAQLNTELLAQKDARARAEQQAAASAAQLSAVIASANAKPASLDEARQTAARPTTAMSVPATPPPTAELRTNASPPALIVPAPADGSPLIHVVLNTDTLEKIAQKYYGDPSRWRTIYFANNAQLSGGRPLKAGMKLEIPQN